MELYQMIYRRLRNDERLIALTAKYNGGAAVFYQRPASAENARWQSEIQYPRIDYTLDMVENPARNTSGVLTVNVWCDTQVGAEPEDIEARLRELLHATFAQADDFAYCFAWVRSDAFEIKKQQEETIRTVGVTVLFDVTACPCQYTMYPDPIKGLNAWTKVVLPNAVVIGEDTIDGWLVPTREKPAIYWRLTAQGKERQHFAYTWMNIAVECHVYCRNAADRLYNLVQLNTAHALIGHITLEDTSPLFLKTFTVQPHMNYITTGQIKATGYFGLLQPESHLSNRGTGYKLLHTNIPREIIEEDGAKAQVDGSASRGYKFPYPQSAKSEQTGQRPYAIMGGATADAEADVQADGTGFKHLYQAVGTKPQTNTLFAQNDEDIELQAPFTHYRFPYKKSAEMEQTGQHPQESIVGGVDEQAVATDVDTRQYTYDYPMSGNDKYPV